MTIHFVGFFYVYKVFDSRPLEVFFFLDKTCLKCNSSSIQKFLIGFRPVCCSSALILFCSLDAPLFYFLEDNVSIKKSFF
mmetsp:Transcript_37741/g.87885  ORF Transcript_37741/g.87885 Transcript_37741/m.87885 type:complete len:80 (-) Transcript_37741:25-264(-)